MDPKKIEKFLRREQEGEQQGEFLATARAEMGKTATRSPRDPKPSTTSSSALPAVPPPSTGWKQKSTPTAGPRDLPAGSASYTS
jgi:hypothetical protein